MENIIIPNSRTSVDNDNTNITAMAHDPSQSSSGPTWYSGFSGFTTMGFPPRGMGTWPSYHQILQVPLSCTDPTLQSDQFFAGYPACSFEFQQNTSNMTASNGILGAGLLFRQTNGLKNGRQGCGLDPNTSNIVSMNCKLARQSSLSLQKIEPSRASLNVSGLNLRRQASHPADTRNYNFLTPDNKRLMLILRKEIQKSDLKSTGRIVIPKRKAEEHLPLLSDKEGIWLLIKDVYSYRSWIIKYRYWCNKGSRMYILEYTRDFIKQNGLEIGDLLTLYEDESKNLYFTIMKKGIPGVSSSHKQYCKNDEQAIEDDLANSTEQAKIDDDAALDLFLKEIENEGQQKADDNLISPMVDYQAASRHDQFEELKAADDLQGNIIIDENFGVNDMLPYADIDNCLF